MSAPNQNIQSLGANGLYGTYTNYGGGGTPVARSEMDFLRMGVGREPSAEYPDGYLGTIRSRRDDRGRPNSVSEQVMQGLKVRLTQRGYQRGVHRGERIDQNDYYLPNNLTADRDIKRQMAAAKRGVPVPRFAPAALLAPAPHLPNDGKAGPLAKSDSPYQINQVRQSQLRNMKPGWK
jgi:hypothetical protein